MTDHAREIGAALGLRPPARTDLAKMIEAATSAAWQTDKGAVIAGAVVAALREKAIMLPAPATIERAGITGRATARIRVHETLLAGLGPEQMAALHELLSLDPDTAGGLIRRAANRHLGKREREAAGGLSSAQRHPHFLGSARINQTMASSDFRFADVKEAKATAILVLPPERLDAYARWPRLMVAQAIHDLARSPAGRARPLPAR
jgi:hypothetical protein